MTTDDYTRGFATATQLTIEQAEDQLSSMSADHGTTYDDGIADGRVYRGYMAECIRIHPDSGQWDWLDSWVRDTEDHTADGGQSVQEQLDSLIAYDPCTHVLHDDGSVSIREDV